MGLGRHNEKSGVIRRQFKGLLWWSSGCNSTLPMQAAQVQSLVRELDPICHNQEPMCCDKKILHATTNTWIILKNKYFLNDKHFQNKFKKKTIQVLNRVMICLNENCKFLKN